jgi:hypothetical protein
MAAHLSDPAIKRAALRMREGGLGCTTIARELGVAKSTVMWWVRGGPTDGMNRYRPCRNPQPKFWRCPGCGGRSVEPSGHTGCAA